MKTFIKLLVLAVLLGGLTRQGQAQIVTDEARIAQTMDKELRTAGITDLNGLCRSWDGKDNWNGAGWGCAAKIRRDLPCGWKVVVHEVNAFVENPITHEILWPGAYDLNGAAAAQESFNANEPPEVCKPNFDPDFLQRVRLEKRKARMERVYKTNSLKLDDFRADDRDYACRQALQLVEFKDDGLGKRRELWACAEVIRAHYSVGWKKLVELQAWDKPSGEMQRHLRERALVEFKRRFDNRSFAAMLTPTRENLRDAIVAELGGPTGDASWIGDFGRRDRATYDRFWGYLTPQLAAIIGPLNESFQREREPYLEEKRRERSRLASFFREQPNATPEISADTFPPVVLGTQTAAVTPGAPLLGIKGRTIETERTPSPEKAESASSRLKRGVSSIVTVLLGGAVLLLVMAPLSRVARILGPIIVWALDVYLRALAWSLQSLPETSRIRIVLTRWLNVALGRLRPDPARAPV